MTLTPAVPLLAAEGITHTVHRSAAFNRASGSPWHSHLRPPRQEAWIRANLRRVVNGVEVSGAQRGTSLVWRSGRPIADRRLIGANGHVGQCGVVVGTVEDTCRAGCAAGAAPVEPPCFGGAPALRGNVVRPASRCGSHRATAPRPGPGDLRSGPARRRRGTSPLVARLASGRGSAASSRRSATPAIECPRRQTQLLSAIGTTRRIAGRRAGLSIGPQVTKSPWAIQGRTLYTRQRRWTRERGPIRGQPSGTANWPTAVRITVTRLPVPDCCAGGRTRPARTGSGADAERVRDRRRGDDVTHADPRRQQTVGASVNADPDQQADRRGRQRG